MRYKNEETKKNMERSIWRRREKEKKKGWRRRERKKWRKVKREEELVKRGGKTGKGGRGGE